MATVSPIAWKVHALVSRAFRFCSNDQHLKNEIKHLKKVFKDINGYTDWTIEQFIENVKNQNGMTRSTQILTNTEENEHLLMLPYKRKARTISYIKVVHLMTYRSVIRIEKNLR